MKPNKKMIFNKNGMSVKVEIFHVDNDLTLAKATQKIDGIGYSPDTSYGWAYRSPEDKPNRRKGARVALEKALDHLLMTSKVRHTILSDLSLAPELSRKPQPETTTGLENVIWAFLLGGFYND
jgi:hypothetical protein